MTGEMTNAIISCANYIKHFHISQPLLSSVENMDENKHMEFASALRKIKYKGWVVIEMKRSNGLHESNIERMRKSIKKVKNIRSVTR